jgi:hypothetical protein
VNCVSQLLKSIVIVLYLFGLGFDCLERQFFSPETVSFLSHSIQFLEQHSVFQ